MAKKSFTICQSEFISDSFLIAIKVYLFYSLIRLFGKSVKISLIRLNRWQKKHSLFVNLNLFQILFQFRCTHNHQLSQHQLSINTFPLWHPFLRKGQGIGKTTYSRLCPFIPKYARLLPGIFVYHFFNIRLPNINNDLNLKIMKKLLLSAALLVIGFLNAQVKIGDNPTSLNAGSLLELESTTQGFLLPRLTYAQKTAIVTPPAGLQVWCTNCGTSGELQLFNGTIWVTSNVVEGNLPPIPIVTICAQVWMQNNLDVTTYRNGESIPYVTNATTWAALTTGAYCSYNNNPANDAIYGKLYNWYAVNDPRGLAPTGYHVPTDTEWTTLTTCLGGTFAAGGKMKEIGTTHWNSPNTSATNEFGFTGLPGGYRDGSGIFDGISYGGFWWCSSEKDTTYAWYRSLGYNFGSAYRSSNFKIYGLSVRCLRD